MSERTAAASGGHVRTAERKLLTFLFADLSGYTRLTATKDPEDVQLTVGPLLAELRQVAEEHGGYVPSVQGDGFMSVFGVPVSHADDPRRAIDAAAAMQAVVATRREAVPDIPDVHIGIASGEVLVTPNAGGQDVIGPAVNLAARLSDAAVPGEVLVDEAAAQLTSRYGMYGEPQLLRLSGFADSIRAVPLLGVAPAGHADARPLAGRAAPLAAFDRALEEVLATRTSAVLLVTGEPGAGKSHLVSAWASGRPDAVVLRGTARPYGSALPLSALSEAIVGAQSHAHGASAESFRRLLPRQRAASATGREPDEALHVAARRWLEDVSAREPVILLLEDLHWADDALLEVLRALHDKPLSGRLLILGTTREGLSGLPHTALQQLTPAEIAEIVEQQLGARPDDMLTRLLVERSGGNALWLVECLNLLRDREQLVVAAGTVGVKELGDEIEVPASVRMLVAARVDGLPGEDKLALQRASVRPGDIGADDWPGRPDQLQELVRLGLLTRLPGGGVRFAHGLIREAIYRSMPRAVRVREHEHVLANAADPAARAYAALEVQRLDVAPDEARRAIVAEQALGAVTEHARHLRASHTRAARDVLLRAEELCAEVDMVAPRAAADFLTELAEVLLDLEDADRSRRTADRARAVAQLTADDELLLRAQLVLGAGFLGHDNTAARHVAEEALAHTTLAPLLQGRAWQLLAGSHAYDDMTQLQHCLEEAFACYSEAGDVAAGAEAARRLAFNLSVTADARFDHWLGVAISTTADVHLRGQGEIALVRAVVSQARGEWEASWAAAQSAMELSERAGMHRSLVDAMAVAIEAATATGRRTVLPELIARLTTLMQGHRARLQITGLCAIAPAAMLLGDEDQAWRSLAQARSLLPSVGRNEQAMVLVAEAHTAALARRHDVAAAAYAQAEALAGELGFSLARLGYRFHRLQAEASHHVRPGLQAEVLALADELAAAGAGSYAEAARKLADNLSA